MKTPPPARKRWKAVKRLSDKALAEIIQALVWKKDEWDVTWPRLIRVARAVRKLKAQL